MFERFTERARQVVVLAQEEARTLEHAHIGTAHLLLGLLRQEDGIAARVLGDLGITLERVRAEVVRIVEPGAVPASSQIPFTPRAKEVLELARSEAKDHRLNYVGTEHVLLGLVRESEGIAVRLMLDAGADAETIRNAVDPLLPGPSPAPEPPPPPRGAGPPGERERGGRWREEVTSSLQAILHVLVRWTEEERRLPRRRARRLAEDAIRRHDPGAEAKLGTEAWDALVAEVLDANPDVEPADS